MQFIDLKQQYQKLKNNIDKSIKNVIDDGSFIQGDQVKNLERRLSDYIGGGYCISCANGTDALYVALRALNVKSGDEVIVPSFTWVSTAEVVKLLDAVPVFADIDQNTFNISVEDISKKITPKTKAIIPVSIFGRACEFIEICNLAKEKGIFVIEDSAQGFGSKYKGIMSCSYADISTTSFFPAKPLGCYGDGGAIFTPHKDLSERINIITKHGQSGRYNYIDIGVNSRLDTIQAAILLEKLEIYEEEIDKRNKVAKLYQELITHDLLTLPSIGCDENRSVWAQYTVLLDESIMHYRLEIMGKLKEKNIPSALYYPAPLHLQKPYFTGQKLEITENVADRVLSLPMHPYLNEDEIKYISSELISIIEKY